MTRLDLIKDVLARTWRGPILRALASGPLRYGELGSLVSQQEERPLREGYLNTELRDLRRLGLIVPRSVRNAKHHVWTLTDEGRRVVETLKMIDLDASPQSPTNSRESSTATDGSNKATSARDSRAAGRRTAERKPADEIAGSGISSDFERKLTRVDTTVPHPARRYNYWLGGKDNFAADRKSGDEIAKMMPTIRMAVLENRYFQRRVVRFLAQEAGVRQFLDIGTGIPALDNPHEVAQAIDPACRVVYVDNDPIVLAHSRALLNSTPQGATAYVEADAREPEKILSDRNVLATLDFSRPIGLLLIALLHFVDDDSAYALVRTLVDALPVGSFLAVSHTTWDHLSPAELETAAAAAASGRHGAIYPRSLDQIMRFFDGLDLVAPGVCPIAEWHAVDEPQPRPATKDIAVYGAVARIP